MWARIGVDPAMHLLAAAPFSFPDTAFCLSISLFLKHLCNHRHHHLLRVSAAFCAEGVFLLLPLLISGRHSQAPRHVHIRPSGHPAVLLAPRRDRTWQLSVHQSIRFSLSAANVTGSRVLGLA
ncbi:hypothetical protein IQ07DRAFT_15385 [Pyrenochaeta sp. DS3sAY3a]|nr:hypothetical protein IQ07DRAFT_15385 [Pyrenochaeta sp. DS3sAY3a]